MTEIRILIVFDAKTSDFPLERLKKKLTYERVYYDVIYTTKDIGRWLRKKTYSLLLLCFTEENGVDEVMRIRTHSFIPILVFSHTDDFHDQILYLRAGADECMDYGFRNIDIIINKIKALIRRSYDYNSRRQKSIVIKNKDMVIYHDTRTVIVDNKKITLTPTEYKILFYLAQNAGRILSREQIYENVWNEPYDIINDPLDTHFYHIRAKLGGKKKPINTSAQNGG